MILQLNPSIPIEVIGKGTGEAIFLLDYSKEDNLMWIIALDSDGSVWTVPNPDIRFIKNYSLGRNFDKLKKI